MLTDVVLENLEQLSHLRTTTLPLTMGSHNRVGKVVSFWSIVICLRYSVSGTEVTELKLNT